VPPGLASRLLDHVIVLNERHLKRLMREYIRYHHKDEPIWGWPGHACGPPRRNGLRQRNQVSILLDLVACIIATPWQRKRNLRTGCGLGRRLIAPFPFAITFAQVPAYFEGIGVFADHGRMRRTRERPRMGRMTPQRFLVCGAF
jgi:hypothetical protein